MTPTEFDWSIDPECSLGYSKAQLREQFGDEHAAFGEHMLKKASPVRSGTQDTISSIGPERPCDTPHGHVFCVHDVIRFVEHA
ncbi:MULTISPECIES: hypothetical protein [unclassified Leucobacter]|uniref:hypothetical protein n=1 Tax=unclassified Leucobacter TaxID=2621730 RepID=UPI0006228EBF|nr:hypothetical protein [Leucobacter sp. Ag1]KKI22489.1 hypothetical protein XM48_01485 [Leucobacter sp. Ag1]